MQFQHGTYIEDASGSLHLTPIAVDGRQLLSNPCQYSSAVYTRYNQSELFKASTLPHKTPPPTGPHSQPQRFEYIAADPYHNIPRLNLFKFDGSPMNPMYLAYKPPQMLPTQTLNPTTAKTSGGAKSTSKSKVKRNIDEGIESMQRNEPFDADKWWWIAVGLTGVGAMGWYCF